MPVSRLVVPSTLPSMQPPSVSWGFPQDATHTDINFVFSPRHLPVLHMWYVFSSRKQFLSLSFPLCREEVYSSELLISFSNHCLVVSSSLRMRSGLTYPNECFKNLNNETQVSYSLPPVQLNWLQSCASPQSRCVENHA